MVKVSAIGAEVLNQLYLRREGNSGGFFETDNLKISPDYRILTAIGAVEK